MAGYFFLNGVNGSNTLLSEVINGQVVSQQISRNAALHYMKNVSC